MEKIQKAVKELMLSHHYSSCMTKTLDLIVNDKMNRLELNRCLSENNMSIDDIKTEALSFIIDYSKAVLEDSIITKEEIRNITLFRLFYSVKDGDFFEYGKKEDVYGVLLQQLRKLYADNSIDREEAVMKTELQGLFGLCYEDFLEINNIAAKEAFERGADISKLDTVL